MKKKNGAIVEKFLVLKNKNAEVKISLEKGGTITGITFGGVDTSVTRAGCEFWGEGTQHYEQEFGCLIDKKCSKEGDNLVALTRAELVCPTTKRSGGVGEIMITLEPSGRVTSAARMFPFSGVVVCNYDQYFCFSPDYYTEHKIVGMDSDFLKVGKPDSGEVFWQRNTYNQSCGVMAKNGKIKIYVSASEPLRGHVGAYRSASMFEIKCKDMNPARVSAWSHFSIEKL